MSFIDTMTEYRLNQIGLHDRETESSVYIDHDILFDEYDVSYIKKWCVKLPYEVKSMDIRKSSSGNTHVRITVSGELTRIDELMIRAIMHDDSRRIRGDLERLCLGSSVFGLIFSEKGYLPDIVKKCGEWQEVYPIP